MIKRTISVLTTITIYVAIGEISEKYRINKNVVIEEAIRSLIGELEKGMTIPQGINSEPKKRFRTSVPTTLLESIKKHNLDLNAIVETGVSRLAEKIKQGDIETIISLKRHNKQQKISNTEILPVLGEAKKKILTALSDNHSGLSLGEISEKTGIEKQMIRIECKKMRKNGMLNDFGTGSKFRYAITDYGISILKTQTLDESEDERIEKIKNFLEKRIADGKATRTEKIIYTLLGEEKMRLPQIEISKKTGIDPGNSSGLLQIMEKKEWVIILRGKGRKIAILNINKVLREGPPVKNYADKIGKFLLNGPATNKEIFNVIFQPKTKTNTRLYFVLAEMKKNGEIEIKGGLGRKGQTAELTEKGEKDFDVFREKNFPFKPIITEQSLDSNGAQPKLKKNQEEILKIIREKGGNNLEFLKKNFPHLSTTVIKGHITELERLGLIKTVFILCLEHEKKSQVCQN